MLRRPVVIALSSLLACTPLHAQVVFDVTFDATASPLTTTERTQIQTHVQEAGRRWVQALGIAAARRIDVRVGVSNAPTANGASTTSTLIGNVGGRDLYEQGVAYELRTGVDPNGTDADAVVTFGLAYLRNELWFDPDPTSRTVPVPALRTDAMSVALHEVGHVLAYNGWADLTTGVSPATYWSTYDRWLLPGAPSVVTGPRSVMAWGSAPDVTTGNNKHWGNAAASVWRMSPLPYDPVHWENGAPVPLAICDVPSVDAPPSRTRAAAASPTASLVDELMNGVVFYRGTRYDISPLDHALMADVGLLVDAVFAHGFE